MAHQRQPRGSVEPEQGARHPLATLGLLVGMVVLCLAGAELAVAHLGLLEYPPSMDKGHPRRGYTLRPGFDGYTAYGVHVRINSLGLRSPEIPIPKPPGTHRVLVLGDSVTFGAGVNEAETFSRKLESMLRHDLDCPVDVVNAGISGYGSVQELDVLEHEGLQVQPDVVVVYHIENDNEVMHPHTSPVAVFLKDHVFYRSYLVSTGLFAYLRLRWLVHAATRGGDVASLRAEVRNWDARPGTADSLDALRQIAAVARARGLPVVLASHPGGPILDATIDARRNTLLREVANETGMTFVDMRPAFVPYAGEDLAVSERNHHPNGRGHSIIAAALRPVVRPLVGCPLRAEATP
jgi:lysophospholipase L1-like esterase